MSDQQRSTLKRALTRSCGALLLVACLLFCQLPVVPIGATAGAAATPSFGPIVVSEAFRTFVPNVVAQWDISARLHLDPYEPDAASPIASAPWLGSAPESIGLIAQPPGMPSTAAGHGVLADPTVQARKSTNVTINGFPAFVIDRNHAGLITSAATLVALLATLFLNFSLSGAGVQSRRNNPTYTYAADRPATSYVWPCVRAIPVFTNRHTGWMAPGNLAHIFGSLG